MKKSILDEILDLFYPRTGGNTTSVWELVIDLIHSPAFSTIVFTILVMRLLTTGDPFFLFSISIWGWITAKNMGWIE